MFIDLHLHSEFSDGKINGQHIKLLNNLYDFATITDHDNVAFHRIYSNVEKIGVGVELTVQDGNSEIHLLVYIKELNEEIIKIVNQFTEWRNWMIEYAMFRIVEILRLPFVPSMKKIPGGCYSTAILDKIVEQHGHNFFSFLENHDIFPQKYYTIEETLDMFEDKSSVRFIIAHPKEKDFSKRVLNLLKEKIIHGIEINISKNNLDVVLNHHYKSEYISVGSDCHGIPNIKEVPDTSSFNKEINNKIQYLIEWLKE